MVRVLLIFQTGPSLQKGLFDKGRLLLVRMYIVRRGSIYYLLYTDSIEPQQTPSIPPPLVIAFFSPPLEKFSEGKKKKTHNAVLLFF